MRVWLRSDGRLVWEQNVFSRRTEGRREWLNPTSGQWVGREWVAQVSGGAAFVLVRDGAPEGNDQMIRLSMRFSRLRTGAGV
jgi:hypothetical protein